jgi:TP901-1 family phage major tail protein
MAKSKGRLLLIKIGDGAETEVFTSLCGLNTRGITINNSEYDVTTADCADPGGALWTEVQNGVKRVAVTGSGFMKDDTAEARLNTVAMSVDALANFQVIVPGLGTFAGEFHVASAGYTGELQGGVSYDISLNSSGVITFTAEA